MAISKEQTLYSSLDRTTRLWVESLIKKLDHQNNVEPQFIEVSDIDSPAELAAYGGTVEGILLVAYLNDQATIYRLSSSATVNSPYVVAGDGVYWVAVGGKYTNSQLHYTGLTASRLLGSDADKGLASTDLFDWIESTLGALVITDDGVGGVDLDVDESNIDHSLLGNPLVDTHLQYLLASDATSRAAFATNWTDLTDGGNTIMHVHDIYLLADGTRALAGPWSAAGYMVSNFRATFSAGTATAGTAPAYFTSGPLLTVPVAGTFEFLTDKFYLTQTTGPTRKEIKLIDQYFADMYAYENAGVTTINTQNVYVAVYQGLASNILSGFTFTAGAEGTGNITDYSGTVAGTVKMNDAGHGRSTGDFLTIHGSTNYNEVVEIIKIDDDNFYWTKAWVADEAADWAMGAYLECSAGSGGYYRAILTNSAFAAVANTIFKFEIFLNAASHDESATERKFTSTDYGAMAAGSIISLAEGDRLWFAVMNKTAATDITVVHANLSVVRG